MLFGCPRTNNNASDLPARRDDDPCRRDEHLEPQA
ncbi:hypothetical protein predicted by Glimmer/Critica [Azoarcus olearius]|uniref:Uncharacterized protein n=1 Tax=Azoarcus sp. (strain BH72) TaxID=418699 RepID=A1K8P8_AZOSB|nr:hypothetical protein predicted by Glimmer/Critica [Azoarcus olearius]